MRPLRPLLATLLVASLLSLAPVADALCAAPMLVGTMVTPLDAPVPRDGGLLVRVDYGYGAPGVRATRGPDQSVRLPELTLVRGAIRVTLVPHPLPGGLVRLAFAHAPPPGTYTLLGFSPEGAPAPEVTIGGSLPPAPLAPTLAQVAHRERVETSTGPRGGSRVTYWTTRLTLAQPLGGTPAFVALRRVGVGESAQLIEVDATRTALQATGSLGGRCQPGLEPGRAVVAAGAQVDAVVIDRFGRVSPPSAPVRVR